MERKAYDSLTEWKKRDNRNCLIVEGQRQIGKTHLIRRFAEENYSNSVYIDFNERSSGAKLFDGDLSVDGIVKGMEHYADTEIEPGETLIIMDEIQECPRARASLKYFSMDRRYDVIASGSLLGINIPPTKDAAGKNGGTGPLIPVGYEEHLLMRSMDFEEFLWANGVKKKTVGDIRRSIRGGEPLNEAVLSKYEAHFRDFMIVGGMPRSVQEFVDSGKYTGSGLVLENILKSCRDDIVRYNAGADKIRTLECFDSIPAQLAKSNKKFMYSEIKGDLSRKGFSIYSDNLLWIKGAGYGNFCTAVSAPSLPLESYEMKDSFKVYLSDTGLLAHMYGNDTLQAIYAGDTKYNFGAIAENAVAEGLTKCGFAPRFYRKDGGTNRMELDFVIPLGNRAAVIEVKSGRRRDSPSLNKVSSVFDIGRKIIFGNSNICEEEDTECYPLFASAFADELKPESDGPEF